MKNPDIVIGLRLMRDEFKRNAIGHNEAKFRGRADLVNTAADEIVRLHERVKIRDEEIERLRAYCKEWAEPSTASPL